ncbi:MAG: TonB-dependent receptor [Acidobacteria bacterium]|nr:TonB-dependent receptor [Acidobacteriota bacterium]
MLAVGTALAQEATDTRGARDGRAETVRGRVIDATGGALPGAAVTLTDATGNAETVATDATGTYVFSRLAPGRYTVHAFFTGFAPYANTEVRITAGRTTTLPILLNIEPVKEEITLKYEPTFHRGTVVLSGDDKVLPEDPDDLAADLEALAGSSATPQGTQVFVDGFSGARLPPKAAIREFRTNQNPFSAVNDRVGFGRIEVFTKPGSDTLRGQVFFNFGHGMFNARNPFYPWDHPLFRESFSGGNLGGPLSKRASFVVDMEARQINTAAVIRATVLDANLNIMPLLQTVDSPQHRVNVTPRLDYQLNQNNTLVARYANTRIGRDNVGIGELSLPLRGYSTLETEHVVQLTETAVLSSQAINETRLQFVRTSTESRGNSSVPTINVSDAFIGGGTDIGYSFVDQNRWEIQNSTYYVSGAHTRRWGARFRAATIADVSRQNFGGTFRFPSGTGPKLDGNNEVVMDPAGQPVSVPLTALERYRRTVLFQSQGLTGVQTRELGGGASQFSLTAGNPRADVSQADLGVYFQDDWTIRANFRLSLGVRYEWQNNLHFWKDLAPRISLAWAPGEPKTRKTAVRVGAGIFYDRFSEKLTLQTVRENGLNQHQYQVRNPNFFPTVPPVQTLGDPLPATIRRVASDLRAPHIIQASIGIERLLPLKATVTSTLSVSRGRHLLRSRNINAPLPGTFIPGDATSGIRPYGPGNIFLYESSGSLKQSQWNTNVSSRLHKDLTLSVLYVLNYATSDTDGPTTFPANPYDDSIESGRSVLDERHRFVLTGTIAAPGKFQFSSSIVARSGTPFNITLGRDTNGDSLLTERPGLAAHLNSPGTVITPFGALDPNPPPGEEITRNYGRASGYFTVNLKASRTFGFGTSKSAPSKGAPSSGAERPYNFTLSVSARNLFNRVNRATPIGNLASPLFGTATSLADVYAPAPGAGNRRVEVQLRLKF